MMMYLHHEAHSFLKRLFNGLRFGRAAERESCGSKGLSRCKWYCPCAWPPWSPASSSCPRKKQARRGRSSSSVRASVASPRRASESRRPWNRVLKTVAALPWSTSRYGLPAKTSPQAAAERRGRRVVGGPLAQGRPAPHNWRCGESGGVCGQRLHGDVSPTRADAFSHACCLLFSAHTLQGVPVDLGGQWIHGTEGGAPTGPIDAHWVQGAVCRPASWMSPWRASDRAPPHLAGNPLTALAKQYGLGLATSTVRASPWPPQSSAEPLLSLAPQDGLRAPPCAGSQHHV